MGRSLASTVLVGIVLGLVGGCQPQIRPEPDRVTLVFEVPNTIRLPTDSVVCRVGVVGQSVREPGGGVGPGTFRLDYHVTAADKERRTVTVEITCSDGTKKTLDVTVGDPPKDTGCKTVGGLPIFVSAEHIR